ncbi:MAG: hypothetical protein Q9221_002735 [Calogaya cf. arnoldii]
MTIMFATLTNLRMRLDAEFLEIGEWKRDVSASIDAIARHLGIDDDVTGAARPTKSSINASLPSVAKRQTKNNPKSTLVVNLDEPQEALVLEATSTYLQDAPKKDVMKSRGKSGTGSAEHKSRKWLEGIIAIIEGAASTELGEDTKRTLTGRLASMTEDQKQATCIYFTKPTPLKGRQDLSVGPLEKSLLAPLSVRIYADGLLKVRVGTHGIDPALYPRDTSQEGNWQLSDQEERTKTPGDGLQRPLLSSDEIHSAKDDREFYTDRCRA